MGKTEKKLNKLIIGAVIGGTLIGLGSLSMTPKGKSFWKRFFGRDNFVRKFMRRGVQEMRRTLKK